MKPLFTIALCLIALALPARSFATPVDVEDFSAPSSAWTTFGDPPVQFAWDSTIGHDKAGSISIDVPQSVSATWYNYCRALPALKQNTIYRATVWIKTKDVSGGAGAYFGIGFFDAAGKRTSNCDSSRISGTNDWFEIEQVFTVPEGTTSTKIMLIDYGHGQAWFDDMRIDEVRSIDLGPISASPTIDIDARRPVTKSLIGLGAQVLPWFYLSYNKDNGATEDDFRMIEAREKEMGISYSRLFVDWDGWNPSHDCHTYVWDTPFMQALIRSLTVLKEAGASVNLTMSPSKECVGPGKSTVAIADFMKHMVSDLGFTNIRYETYINEPAASGGITGVTYDLLKDVSRNLYIELKKRGLEKQVAIVETDGDIPWAARAKHEFDDVLGGYSGHFYSPHEIDAALTSRLREIAGSNRPVFINEFNATGMGDAGPNDSYESGIELGADAIEFLNAGAAAISYWDLSDCYIYRWNRPFPWGLWHFKDKNWSVKPVYHIYRLFMRYARPGSSVLACRSSDSGWIKALAVRKGNNWSIYALNLSTTPTHALIRFHGAAAPKDLRLALVTQDIVKLAGDIPIDPSAKAVLRSGEIEVDLPAQSMVCLTNVSRKPDTLH